MYIYKVFEMALGEKDSLLVGKNISKWFAENRRKLSWRSDPSPYRVWISEVMLQQTQASVVEGYFEKWIDRFPSVSELARAKSEEVIKAWEGLGYYSRARNLHKAAQFILEHYKGKIPSSLEELRKVPGIGPYTAGAIVSFAFGGRASAIDGNVKRVIARLIGLEVEIDKREAMKKVESCVNDILPQENPAQVMEGLIELGAVVCKKKPQCIRCPIKRFCSALRKGITDQLPIKKKRVPITALHRQVVIIEVQGHVLIKKEDTGSVMADLYQFPFFEMGKRIKEEDMKCYLWDHFDFEVSYKGKLSMQQHGFTRFRSYLYPTLWEGLQMKEISNYEWVARDALEQLPFSAGHRRIKELILES